MRLDKVQFQQTKEAILRAFGRDDLRKMLRLQLDEDLDRVTGDDDLDTIVFDLITWAEQNGRLGDLIAGALAAKPNNAALQKLAADYARWEKADQAAEPVQPTPVPVQQPTSPVTQLSDPTPPPSRRSAQGWLLGLAGIAVVAVIVVILGTNGVIPWPGTATSTPVAANNVGGEQQPIATDTPTSTTTPTPTDTPDSNSDTAFLVVSSTANVRSGPGTNYELVGTVSAGDMFPIVAKNEAGDWYQIMVNDKLAWIFSALTTAKGDTENLPIQEATEIPVAESTPPIAPTTHVAQATVSIEAPNQPLQAGVDRTGARYVPFDGFWIMDTQVSFKMYRACVDSGICSQPDNNLLYDQSQENKPVTNVNFLQASDYAAWVGGRLPTNQEWEIAACGASASVHFLDNVWEWTDTLYSPATTEERILRGGPPDNDCSTPSTPCTTGWDKPTQPAWCRGFRVVIDNP